MGAIAGFLPVLYSLLQAHFTPPVQLPPDSVDEPVNAQSAGLKLKSEPLRGYKVLLLWLPAACDLTGTTVRQTVSFIIIPVVFADICSSRLLQPFIQLMNVGLLYTPVSIYQMTRGALVLFVGILSVIFLHRRLWLYQCVGVSFPILRNPFTQIKLLLFLLICKPWRSSIDGSRY